MIFLYLAVFISSLSLTGFLRRYALAKNIMDIPNHRSSHAHPTPRGGGVAFVLGFTLILPVLIYLKLTSIFLAAPLLGAGLLIALLGFLDDKASLPATWRLLGHLAAAGFVLYYLGGFPPIYILGCGVPVGAVLNVVALLYLVWLINLYNFMDGIDGLASIEVCSVCVGISLVYWLAGEAGHIILPLLLSAAVAGFLCWNFPPARIFMGDAGSGFLGITLGILSLQGAMIRPDFFWSWLILLGIFIVDATITLLRRFMQGDKLYQAHRSHAYQHASRRYHSHLLVTLAVLVINILWLLPIAILVGLGHLDGFIGMIISYLPITVLAVKFNAGKAS
ncbi:MraY family glycosyltransferase [Legionella septentrionalis]|uniref:MraY family glycosyltransferase n=1 Tax=Legionella septentrionalis TaxID=2498109 RepID=UPI000F8EA4CE|nr:glycosyltransferase family 4 protein [Legionella septentrionalis]RUR11860.1 glycosyltransferase family 4 protein [Legionella septentrionalis]